MKNIWTTEFKKMEKDTPPALVKAGDEIGLFWSQAGKIPFFFFFLFFKNYLNQLLIISTLLHLFQGCSSHNSLLIAHTGVLM